MALPTNISFGTVIGRFMRAVIDSTDPDRDPDGIPLSGLVIRFTPSQQVFKNLTDSFGPVTIVADPIVATTGENGEVIGPDGLPGIRLVATDDPDLIPTGWTWGVSISGGNLPGAISFSMALPSNSTVDLTTVVPIPSNPGEELAAWLAAVQATEAAAAAVQSVVATNDGIMTAVAADSESAFSAQLTARIDAGSMMLAAGQIAGFEALPTRVAPNSDLSASLTPDGRTKTVLLSGQADQVYSALTLGMTQSSDSTRVKAGVASRRFEMNASGIFKADWVEAKTFAPASILQSWVWIDDPTKVTSIAIRPCSLWTRSATVFQAGWNLLRFRASEGVTTSWGTVDYVRVTVTTTAATGINVGELWVESPPKAQACFIEDRGYKTFKDFGVPPLRALNIPITWALDPATHGSSAGTPSEVITDADVAQFYADGDDISIHGYDGFPTSGKTQAQIREDSLRALAWIQDRGYLRGRQWRAAWVQNSAPNASAAQPYFAAYATPTGGASTQSWPLINKWNIARWTLHGKTNAEIDALFDTLQKTREVVFIYTHGVHDTLSGAVTHATWDYFISKCQTAVAEGWFEGTTFSKMLARSGGIVR